MPSKLCPHTLGHSADPRRCVEAGSPVVKLTDVFGLADELLAVRPDLLIVGRLVESGNIAEQAETGQTPESGAQDWMARHREQYVRNPLIKIWEGPNEPVFGAAGDPGAMRRMAWYAAFEAERLRLLADMGLRGVVGNFSTGTPDLPLWTAFLPALDAAERHQGYLGLHEYSSPFMWSLTGRYQLANCDASATGVAEAVPGEGDTGWTTLRYRKAYRQYLAPNGLGDVPLIITECGLDHIGLVCPGQSDGSWRDSLGYWQRYDGARDPIDYWRGPERDPERYYAEQLIWYDRELQKDSYVVGATLFTVGTGMTGGWGGFDISGTRVVDVLVEHIRASRAAETGRPSPVPPGPPPGPGEPVIIVVPPGPEPSRAPAVNLLANAGFEEGQAYFADGTRERAVPSGWSLEYAAPDEPLLPGQSGPFGQPITVLINSHAVTAADRARVFAGGVYCWKVCGTRAPFRVRLWQSLAGLEAGRSYRFTASLLPDVIVRAQPRLTYASDPAISEVRLTVDVGGEQADTGWKTGRDTPFGRYTRLALDFTPVGGRASVAVEVRCRYPLPLGAWYIDELSVAPV